MATNCAQFIACQLPELSQIKTEEGRLSGRSSHAREFGSAQLAAHLTNCQFEIRRGSALAGPPIPGVSPFRRRSSYRGSKHPRPWRTQGRGVSGAVSLPASLRPFLPSPIRQGCITTLRLSSDRPWLVN
jgi:hypothetical protein